MATYTTNANCTANIVVISLVPFLFFLGILFGYLGIFSLNVPFYTLFVIGMIFFIFLLFIKHNANFTICKMRSSILMMEIDLKDALLKNKLTIKGEMKSIFNIENYFRHYYDAIRNDNFAVVASSIFPMLGILGTFVAIAISMPNFSAKDTQSLDNEISLLCSGVGSAFFASIYGILLSLIWTYFEKRGMSKIDNFLAQIRRKHQHLIWSADELEHYKYSQMGRQDDNFALALKNTFSHEFVKSLNDQHLVNVQTIMHETNNNFTKIVEHLKDVSYDLKETVSQIDRSKNAIEARHQIERSLIDFNVATKELDRSINHFGERLDSSLNLTFNKIDSEIANIVVSLGDFAEHVSKESQHTQNAIHRYHQLVTLAAEQKNAL